MAVARLAFFILLCASYCWTHPATPPTTSDLSKVQALKSEQLSIGSDNHKLLRRADRSSGSRAWRSYSKRFGGGADAGKWQKALSCVFEKLLDASFPLSSSLNDVDYAGALLSADYLMSGRAVFDDWIKGRWNVDLLAAADKYMARLIGECTDELDLDLKTKQQKEDFRACSLLRSPKDLRLTHTSKVLCLRYALGQIDPDYIYMPDADVAPILEELKQREMDEKGQKSRNKKKKKTKENKKKGGERSQISEAKFGAQTRTSFAGFMDGLHKVVPSAGVGAGLGALAAKVYRAGQVVGQADASLF